MRRVLSIVLLACATCGSGCASSSEAPARPARINHLAFFTLEDPADADELIADCDAKLATIPGITAYYAGKHLDTGRESVDGSYDVGFYVGFATVETYRNYVEHPNHLAVVEKWRPRLESLRVHDVLDETP